MSVVLRSKLSGFYFKDFGVWTADILDARTFSDEWAARSFIRHEPVDDVQIIEVAEATATLRMAA